LLDLIRQAWLVASVNYGKQQIASGHVLLALIMDETFRVYTELTQLAHIDSQRVSRQLPDIIKGSFESDLSQASGGAAVAPDEASQPAGELGEGSALGRFTIDLTAQAREGKIDPVVGRDREIRQIMDILLRRRQNNPILTGEAGVGKTAVVEGFALRLAEKDAPEALQAASVLSLDLGSLQAGAGVRGEFERRLKSVIDEVKASPSPVIMFIDEAHNLVGAGGQAGQGDAANLLKPALARGELRTIAATTWAEYKKYFEKDAALSRRFQVVKIDEPDQATAVQMMQGLIPVLERHHKVYITQAAIESAVGLSERYISGRQLPDKSVSVLDTTCARIALSQSATPAAVEDARRRHRALEISLEVFEREARAGAENAEKIAATQKQLDAAGIDLRTIEARWQQEKDLAAKVLELRRRLTGESSGLEEAATPQAESDAAAAAAKLEENRPRLVAELRGLESQLEKLQSESPLIHTAVTSQAVAGTVESWTGIPLRRMFADEIHTVLNLRSRMEESIVGQNDALEIIADSVITSRAGMSDPRTPIGVFLLVGTSGVGKTETAITLADLLYGGEQNMTTINMSEFKEEHKVSLLMGSPPGYVGYGEGGVLTEAVRRKPYSVVLLDEMEKAHPGVQDVFYQVFDKGTMKDGEGRDIDFRNTIILMTTNAASDFIMKLCADPETAPRPDAFRQAVYNELLKSFKPAFLGRTTIVPYYPLSDDVLSRIVRLKLGKIGQRVRNTYGAKFSYGDDVVRQVVQRCTEADTGARNIDHVLNKTMLPDLSAQVLRSMAGGQKFSCVQLGIGGDGRFTLNIT
jgi:type VI secretion system protein VasG